MLVGLKVAPVKSKVPPAAALYQLNIVWLPDAVNDVDPSMSMVLLVGVTVGAIGELLTVTVWLLLMDAPFLIILTTPVVPLPGTAVIVVALTTINELAEVPPNFTSVMEDVKLVPVMVTTSALAQADKGDTLLIVGASAANA